MKGIITNILVLRTDNDDFFYDKLVLMLGDTYPIMTLNSNLSEHLKIIEYEMNINKLLIQYVERNKVSQ